MSTNSHLFPISTRLPSRTYPLFDALRESGKDKLVGEMLAITWKRSFLDARRRSAVCVGRVPGAEEGQKGRSTGFGNHKRHTLDGVTTPEMASA